MKRSIQFTAILLALALLLTTAGCRINSLFAGKSGHRASSAASSAASAAASDASAASSVKASFSLPVVLGKNMNPLKTDSMINLTLWPLLYDCLAEPDSGYTTQWRLASSADQAGTTVTVHLRSGVTFSDGSALTARDVLYSYNEVRGDSASFFYSDTANIVNITASGSYTVVFTLKSPDALFGNLLTVPIIKSGSDTAAAPGGTAAPVGSGRYTFSSNDLTGTLTANKSWYAGSVPAIQSIRLVNMLDSSATLTSLKTGVIHYLYADASGSVVPAVGLSTAPVSLNRMVFLGVNWSNSSLANAHIRRAVSLGIDRASVVAEAFSSRATAALLPFNPAWAALQALSVPASSQAASATGKSSAVSGKSSSSSASGRSAASSADSNALGSIDRSQVQSELAAGGISVKTGSTAPVLTLRLLVDSGNQQMTAAARKITASLAVSNIAATVDAEPAAAYEAKLAAGQYDLYLGEIRLTDDMDITPLFHGGAAGYGAPAQSQTQAAFSGWQAGSVTLASLTQTFRGEMPFIPLCFRLGTVAYSADLKGKVAPTFSNVFQNMESWRFG